MVAIQPYNFFQLQQPTNFMYFLKTKTFKFECSCGDGEPYKYSHILSDFQCFHFIATGQRKWLNGGGRIKKEIKLKEDILKF